MNYYEPRSELGWIHFSDTDRQKVMKVIEMLQPDGTVDELGVGVVRNALSDAMFPGITTIMTRAKYFFIVPRILHSYISTQQKNIPAAEYLRQQENEIMNSLAKKYGFEEEKKIIGVTIAKRNNLLPFKKWEELARKPSTIYWNGIRTYKIYNGELSLANLLNSLDHRSTLEGSIGYQAAEGETSDDRDAGINDKFIFSLPDYDKKWKDNLVINLTNVEADFLKHKIIDNYPEILLAKVLKTQDATNDFLNSKNFQAMCEMPFVNSLPDNIKAIIYTARDFWKIMYGAHIRYNYILHSRHGDVAFRSFCNKLWEDWINIISDFDWNAFDRNLLWQITKQHSVVKLFTENFINGWMDPLKLHDFNIAKLDAMVESQESKNKTYRSKLKLQNDEKYDKWIGIDSMDFRFANAKTIIRDITSCN